MLLLSYWEPTEYGGVKFAIIWKLVAIFLIGVSTLVPLRRRGVRAFGTPTVALLSASILAAVCAAVMDSSPESSLRVAAQRLFVVAVLVYAVTTESRRTVSLSCVVWLPVALVVSALPFVLGLVTPIGETFRFTEAYGLTNPGFVGVFQNAHAASLAMGLGMTVAVWRMFVQRSVMRLAFNMVLLAALSALVIATYARTGMAVGLAGAFVLFVTLGRTRLGRIMAVTTGVAAAAVIFRPQDVTPLLNRLEGETIYQQSDDRTLLDRASSGRLTFISEGLIAWGEGGPAAWVFGLGYGGMEDALEARVGHRIPTHNAFADTLVSSGIFGFVVLLGFLWMLARDIATEPDGRVRALGLSLYAGWLVFLLVQGGEMPLHLLVATTPFVTRAGASRNGGGAR